MKILVLGGTGFVGRHIAEALMEAGHAVSIFARGQSTGRIPRQVELIRGDRDQGPTGLDALRGRVWDVCIDVSGYTGRQVRFSAEMLSRSVGHYVFVSAVSVYGDPPSGPVEETHPRLPAADEEVTEITAETYGPLEVACENIVQEIFPERSTLLRPQVLAGAYDPFDRFSYWVRRASQGGEMLAPGDGSDFLQYIDAGDVARFTRTVCENQLLGSFNLAGPRLTWTDFMSILGARNTVWVPQETLRAAGVTEFELPLYRPAGGPRSSLMHISNERAKQAGLTLTEPEATVWTVKKWLPESDLAPALSPEREVALIRLSQGATTGDSMG
jgi:2'-hydroxyisoflavone reductase